MIYQSAAELIGKTPLVRLNKLEKELKLGAELLVKLESRNPAGSAKDRVAYQMILDARESGVLKDGSVIIEPTSGNTGIGLASVAVPLGYRVIIVMPDTMSRERQLLMTAYGAELVLTDGKLGMAGAIKKAEELAEKTQNSFIPGQFVNPSNPKAHYCTTGPEIWADTEGKADCFVAGVGTGGTITGTGRYLKEKNEKITVVAVEPKGSAVLSGEPAGKHGLQGIGAGFIPEILDTEVYDEIMPVTEQEAYAASRLLAKHEGILGGISGGAALHAGIALAKQERFAGGRIVVLLPDSGERYLSTELFTE